MIKKSANIRKFTPEQKRQLEAISAEEGIVNATDIFLFILDKYLDQKRQIKRLKRFNEMKQQKIEDLTNKTKTMRRITMGDSTENVVKKMSEGNIGAMNALMIILKNNERIDPYDAFGGLGPILTLDIYGIYGTDIYVLYSDICEKNISHMLAVLRAVQLSMFSQDVLKDACSRQDYSGKEMIPVIELYDRVKKRLTDFDKEEIKS